MIYYHLFVAYLQLIGMVLSLHYKWKCVFYWCLVWCIYSLVQSCYLMIKGDR